LPNRSKQKGNRAERLVVKAFEDAGYNAKRAWGSSGRSLGMHEEVDCIATINGFTWKLQVKSRRRLSKVFIPDTDIVDAQIIKEDRGELLIVLPLSRFIEEIGRANAKH